MATMKTMYRGNTALQTDIWTLTLEEAQHVTTLLRPQRGDYWDANLVQRTRHQKRQGKSLVTIHTAGFASGEFGNALRCADAHITVLPDTH